MVEADLDPAPAAGDDERGGSGRGEVARRRRSANPADPRPRPPRSRSPVGIICSSSSSRSATGIWTCHSARLDAREPKVGVVPEGDRHRGVAARADDRRDRQGCAREARLEQHLVRERKRCDQRRVGPEVESGGEQRPVRRGLVSSRPASPRAADRRPWIGSPFGSDAERGRRLEVDVATGHREAALGHAGSPRVKQRDPHRASLGDVGAAGRHAGPGALRLGDEGSSRPFRPLGRTRPRARPRRGSPASGPRVPLRSGLPIIAPGGACPSPSSTLRWSSVYRKPSAGSTTTTATPNTIRTAVSVALEAGALVDRQRLRQQVRVLGHAPAPDHRDHGADGEWTRAAALAPPQQRQHPEPAQRRGDHQRQALARQAVVDEARVGPVDEDPGDRDRTRRPSAAISARVAK